MNKKIILKEDVFVNFCYILIFIGINIGFSSIGAVNLVIGFKDFTLFDKLFQTFLPLVLIIISIHYIKYLIRKDKKELRMKKYDK